MRTAVSVVTSAPGAVVQRAALVAPPEHSSLRASVMRRHGCGGSGVRAPASHIGAYRGAGTRGRAGASRAGRVCRACPHGPPSE
jgi:hypothetical protein